MFGWRGRIGLMIPSSNTTMENEFHEAKPEGVSVHTTRLMLKQAVEKELLEMENHLERGCQELKTAMVDVIVYGCTTGSLVKGKGHDEKLQEKIQKLTGVKAITTSGAVLKAFSLLQAQNIAVITPYVKELDEKEVGFFEANGLKVGDICGLGLADNLDIGRLEPKQIYHVLRKINLQKMDALFISCTNWRVIEIIKDLEDDIGLPVVTSNQASLVMALKEMGLSAAGLPHLGRLCLA